MASAASRKRLRELPSPEEMRQIVFNLKPHSDANVVLWAAAYLDHTLESLLVTSFVKLGKEDAKRLFDTSAGGVLGSFNAKIRIAHAMGLVAEDAKHDLLLVNEIRNVFAHSLHTINFSDEPVIKDCAALGTPDTVVQMGQNGVPDVFSTRERFEICFQFVYMRLIGTIKILEHRKRTPENPALT